MLQLQRHYFALDPFQGALKINFGSAFRAIDPLISYEYAGFRPNGSCTDQINTLYNNTGTGIRML